MEGQLQLSCTPKKAELKKGFVRVRTHRTRLLDDLSNTIIELAEIKDVFQTKSVLSVNLNSGAVWKLKAPSEEEAVVWFELLVVFSEATQLKKQDITICDLYKEAMLTCLEFLKVHGVKHRLVFRANDSTAVQLLHSLLVSPLETLLNAQAVDQVACALKAFLSRLPETLLTRRLFPNFMTAARNKDVDAIRKLIGELPSDNAEILEPLVRLCADITRNHKETEMDAKALTVCVGVCLLLSNDREDFDYLKTSPDMTNLVEIFCQNDQTLFVPFLARTASTSTNATSTGNTGNTNGTSNSSHSKPDMKQAFLKDLVSSLKGRSPNPQESKLVSFDLDIEQQLGNAASPNPSSTKTSASTTTTGVSEPSEGDSNDPERPESTSSAKLEHHTLTRARVANRNKNQASLKRRKKAKLVASRFNFQVDYSDPQQQQQSQYEYAGYPGAEGMDIPPELQHRPSITVAEDHAQQGLLSLSLSPPEHEPEHQAELKSPNLTGAFTPNPQDPVYEAKVMSRKWPYAGLALEIEKEREARIELDPEAEIAAPLPPETLEGDQHDQYQQQVNIHDGETPAAAESKRSAPVSLKSNTADDYSSHLLNPETVRSQAAGQTADGATTTSHKVPVTQLAQSSLVSCLNMLLTATKSDCTAIRQLVRQQPWSQGLVQAHVPSA